MHFYIIRENILLFIFYIAFFISFIEIKEKVTSKTATDCEKLINYYTQQKYDSQEYCNANNQIPNSKCNEMNYRNIIINLCKKDLLNWYKKNK